MSIAVYNSSDVDISGYITEISNLEKFRDINNKITIPEPTIMVHTLDYNIDDELYILFDGVKKFHLYICEIKYHSDTNEYEWECSDIIYKLKEYSVYQLSTSWWTLGSWWSPSVYDMKYPGTGTWTSRYISVIFILKLMLHLIDSNLSYNDIIAEITDEASPYKGHYGTFLDYKYLAFNWDMFKFIGRSSDSDNHWDCLTLFEVFNWLLDILNIHVEYSDEKYYLKTTQAYSFPSDDKVYKRKNEYLEPYEFIKVSLSYGIYANYWISPPVTLVDYTNGSTETYGKRTKTVGLPNSFVLFEISVPDGWLLKELTLPSFLRSYFDVVLNNFHYPIQTSEIETDITVENAAYINKLDVKKLTSKIKCKNPDYGFPYTLPLILR